MRKCDTCFKYYPSSWCLHQNRGKYYRFGCDYWRSERSWLLILAQYLTDFWYDHIRSLFRR